MYRRMTALAVLFTAAIAIPSVSADASRACGITHLNQGGSAKFSIERGSISCANARAVVKQYGLGRLHYSCASHSRSCSYTTYPGGWRCGPLEQGGSECWLGGNNKAAGTRVIVLLKFAPSAPGGSKEPTSCKRDVEFRPGLFAYIVEYVGMTCTEARNFVLARAGHPDPPPSGFECHNLNVEAGGGAEECVSGSRRIKIGYE